MDPLGVNERLVRTSAFRLIEEKWLTARRDGRRSHYTLTESGSRRFEMAYSRIYTPPQIEWDGNWTLVLLPRNGDSPPERLELRRELEWEGFASPTPGLLLHPAANLPTLRRVLDELHLTDKAVVLRAQSLDDFTPEPTATLVSRCWDFTDIGNRYRQFIARFQPLASRLQATKLSPQQAFVVQTLLIHSFRRATLHDPRLPVSRVPAVSRHLPAHVPAGAHAPRGGHGSAGRSVGRLVAALARGAALRRSGLVRPSVGPSASTSAEAF